MNRWVTRGAWTGLFGVALGAFGAHGLRGRLEPSMLEIFEVGVRYQMYHALALILVGLAPGEGVGRSPTSRDQWLDRAGVAFLLGTLVFSGSLYALAMTGQRWLGAITPIGGLMLLAGWGSLARAGAGSSP